MQTTVLASTSHIPHTPPRGHGASNTSHLNAETTTGLRRPKWMRYGGFYRSIDDTSRPWEPSPHTGSPLPVPHAAPVFSLDLDVRAGEGSSLESSPSSAKRYQPPPAAAPPPAPPAPPAAAGPIVGGGRKGEEGRRERRKSSTMRRIAKKLRIGVRSQERASIGKGDVEAQPSTSSNYAHVDRVQPHEWKEWGYYARPLIKGVQVHNTASPPDTLPKPAHIRTTDLTPEEVLDSVISPGGTAHPERWKLGLSHPSLPPRPRRWSAPDPHKPLPFPWEVQLNPFLEHILFGVPRLYWDVREDISAAQYGLNPSDDASASSRPLSPADLAQPATWPFLTHMYVNALADDISPKFAWPCMILNPRGIKVRDVINSVYHNFREYVREEEYYGWTVARRREAAKAHRKRCDPEENANAFKAMYGEVQVDDDMRRIDYLGGRTLFRGLMPHPDASGWVLYLGQD